MTENLGLAGEEIFDLDSVRYATREPADIYKPDAPTDERCTVLVIAGMPQKVFILDENGGLELWEHLKRQAKPFHQLPRAKGQNK
jgi:hypothetical protein